MNQESIHYLNSLSSMVREKKAINIRVEDMCMENMQDEKEKDALIFDTGGGRNGTIAKIVWHVFEYTNHQQELSGYQDKSKVQFYPIVNEVTKDWINDIDIPVLLVMNYATLIYDKQGNDLLLSLLI